jgi:hypothetical protein
MRLTVAFDAFISHATALIDAPSDLLSLRAIQNRVAAKALSLLPRHAPGHSVRLVSKSRSSCATAAITAIVILPDELVRSTLQSARQ